MDLWTNEQVLEFAHERNVSFIRLQFTDMFGMLKNIAVTVNQLEKALEGRLSLESPSISKYCRVEETDLYLSLTLPPSLFSRGVLVMELSPG